MVYKKIIGFLLKEYLILANEKILSCLDFFRSIKEKFDKLSFKDNYIYCAVSYPFF